MVFYGTYWELDNNCAWSTLTVKYVRAKLNNFRWVCALVNHTRRLKHNNDCAHTDLFELLDLELELWTSGMGTFLVLQNFRTPVLYRIRFFPAQEFHIAQSCTDLCEMFNF